MAVSDKSKQILASNIAIVRQRIDVSQEQEDICLRMLAEQVSEGIMSGEVLAAYKEYCTVLGDADVRQKTQFCRYISSDSEFSVEIASFCFFGEGDEALPGTHGKIAYVRNKRGDEAYIKLSKNRRGASPCYVTTFAQACEAVWENSSEFCILPIENNNDGRLYSFYSMLDRYELKICAAAGVSDEDGTHTVFALVGRRVDTLNQRNTCKRFEFSVICEDADSIGNIISAAHELGGQLYSVGTQQIPYDDLRQRFYFAFDFSVASPLPLALYVALEYSRFAPIGLYVLK